MQLIFVCSGNTCRSPLALAAWQVALRESEPEQRAVLERIAVSSAGLNARAGAPASDAAQRVAAHWEVDLSAHQARVWQPAPADWIVAMTAEQVAHIRFALDTRLEGEVGHTRVRALGLFVPRSAGAAWPWPLWDRRGHKTAGDDGGSEGDILDPYGGSPEAYEECADRILRGTRALARTLGERQ